MKLIAVIIIGVFAVTSAIRVPTSWSKKQNVQQTHHKFRTTGRPSVGSEIGFQSRPHVVQMHKHNKINSGRKYQQSVRHPNLKKPEAKNEFKASATLDDWKPIFPAHLIQKDDSFHKNFQPQASFQSYKQLRPAKKSPLYKNYRDDKTHEPSYEERIEEKHVHHEKPLSSHEVPLDIPTRPLYPGEGQWAKKGIKHRPFISQHQFTKPEEEEEEEDDKRPDGYEVFEKNKRLFDKHQDKFRENIDEFPQKHKLSVKVPETKREDDEEEEEEESDDEEEKQEFVPTRLYTQVRRSENAQHLPRLVEDPRLREVIKDSKIQTVYTEEGYEDIAYDHAGHEKTAEEDEGFSEFDEEIEKEKKRKAKERKVVEKEDDSEAEGSQQQPVKKPLRMKKGKLVKNEQVKTMALKEQDNGPELEVVSEVKILEVPNNGTKSEKYVKIFPKVYRYDKSTTEAATTTTTTEVPRLVAMESRVNRHRRQKRYTNDFPKITVDTDFINKINHNLPKIAQKIEKPKYPYYNDPTLHHYSPLRYAEDLDNIPKKTEDDFAFYNQADKIACPEIPTDVDPIPARVKNADEDPENMEETTDVQETVKGPRLKNLGDKIDCLKIRYFGENPLDSPFFQEEEIGPVVPLFKIFKKTRELEVKNQRNAEEVEEKRSYSNNIPVHELRQKSKPIKPVTETDLTILADVVNQFDKAGRAEASTTAQSVLKLEIIVPNTTEAVTSVENQADAATISIITTPKYTIDLKPKHIYHQIELLEYLPPTEQSLDDKQNSTTDAPNDRMGKSLDQETTSTAAPTQEPTAAPTQEPSPESQPLKHRRRLKPRPPPGYPYYQVFDVNKYLPKNNYNNLLNRIIRTSTSFPKRDGASEVYYKDEIKASEQLNVFADVINNIKNSSRDPQQMAASSNRVSVMMNAIDNHRKIPVVEVTDDVATTTSAPRGTIKYASYKTKDKLYEDMINRDRAKYENLELLKVKRLTTTEPYSSDTRISASSNEEEEAEPEEDEEEATETVLGLMPPVPNRYKTIFTPKRSKPFQETKMNLFYVLGMKPPSPKQKIYLYSDYKTHPRIKRKHGYLQRGKRSAQRPAYSEVVRNRNKPIDVEDDTEVVVQDDDDYVPHRPKNYHYDEKTGRIVYDNVKKETEAPEEEYIEITEAPLPKPTRRTSATTAKYEITGPSYVDFVKVLKSNANYTEITDPPPTEKGEEVTTTTTTAKPVSTEPPQFLSFLSKLKSDSNYKEIPDKTTVKTTTTTEAPEAEEEIEETQLENVQNSPGGQTKSPMFQIFDINEYLPKVKNYTPTTSIDYSKYKTIERASVPLRHNLSSRYNSDEDDLENVKTSKVPVVMENKKTEPEEEINPVVSESKHEDVKPRTTTTTEAPSTTTIRRTRTRGKNRGTRRTTTEASATPIPTQRAASSISEEVVHEPYNKPKRVYPRRRPSRIKLNRATTELPDADIEESISAKVVRRRHQKSEDLGDKAIQDRIDTDFDRKTANTDAGFDEKAIKVEADSDEKTTRIEAASDKKITKVEADSDEKTTKTEAASDEKTTKIEVASDEKTTNAERRSDGKSYRIMTPSKEEIAQLNTTQTAQNQTTAESNKQADVQVFKKYDPTKKHGGNYKKESEESEEKKTPDASRLTDVVHKPSAYFTDPKLPAKVNQLVESKVNEEEIAENVEKGEGEEEEEAYDYEESEEKATTTKKPTFVKDPDKRLYYYAPI